MLNNLFRVLLMAVPCLCYVNFAWSVDTPITMGELFARLETAERELSFRGHFTREHGGKIDSFEVLRVVVDGREYRKTHQLNGLAREKISSGRDVRCLTKSNHLLRGHHLNLKIGGSVSLEQSYEFYYLGEDRVAGRPVFVVRIEPKDSYRYGHRFAIDKQTGLVIRSVVMSASKRPLERAQFVFLESLEAEDVLPEILAQGNWDNMVEIDEQGRELESGCQFNVNQTSPWRPSWVPQGFLLTSYRFTEDEGHMETYSDGLGTFSIFVDKVSNVIGKPVLANKGATLVFMSQDQSAELEVSIVGEIPLIAAQKILTSMTRVDSESE